MAIGGSSRTTVGAGGAAPAKSASGGLGGEGVRHRRTAPSSSSSSRTSGGGMRMASPTASSAGMWKFYSDDSPGIKVGPVPVLIMSLVFIFSVFMLHIWGKYTRS